MKRFLRFVRSTSNISVLWVLSLSVMAGLCSALLVAQIGSLFTHLDEGVGWIQVLGIGMLVLMLTALEFFAKKVLLRHSETIAHQLRLSFSQWRIKEPLARVESQGLSAPLATYSEDMKRVTMALEYIPELGVSLAAIGGAVAYLAWVSAPIMLAAIIAVVPAAWIFVLIQRRVRGSLLAVLSARDSSNSLFRTMLAGEKELKLDLARSDEIIENHLKPASETFSKHSQHLALTYTAGTLWTQLCYFAAIVVILLLLAGGWISAQVVAPYVLVALFIRSYIYRFMAGIPHWTAAGAVLDRLDQEGYSFERELEGASATAQPPNLVCEPVVDVSNVCYEYVSERDTSLFTAGPFNLTLGKPEILFVTGQNGVGKSTFLKILCGLYTPKSGEILFNGASVIDENLLNYRSHFSALFTVPHVFPEIPLSVPTDPEKKARFQHYLKVLQLDAKIDLNQSQFVSELSHGQTKRLALLQALIDTRPFIVFDEWAENQDPAYKKVFYYEILPELRDQGRTVVAVTHESNYFDAADRIYTLTANE